MSVHDVQEGLARLEALVAKFRAGEAEIAATMFAQKRPRAVHLNWLRFQIAREARNLEEIAGHLLCRLVERVDEAGAREGLVHRLTEDYQEVRHYAMLAYLYEGLGGEPVEWRRLRAEAKEAAWYEWSRREHARWAELERTGTKLQHAAALFTRGGGGALFYGFIGLQGGDYETLLAEAAKIVLRDELEHGASEGRDELYALIRTPADVDTAEEIIREMSAIRLRMRNEQFGAVLSERRLNEICEGAIEPLTVERLWQACAATVPDWFARYHRTPLPLSSVSILD